MARRPPSKPPVLPGYAHVNVLGLGGFADVFLYEQQMPKRKVAVKVLLRDVVDEPVARMFNAEADVMAQLGSHPSIVTVYEASISSDGRPYIAMEYCPVAIGQRYRKETMAIAEILRIGVKTAGAIESAHRLGVLHRDIKPSNVMVTSFGAPVLADFGIASSLSGNTSVMALSVPWSAPEVVSDQITGSIPSEVWSIGATVYSLLAGHSPFEIPGSGRNSSDELSARVRQAKYTPIKRADIPAELQGILAQSMQANPQRRQQSAEEIGRQLQEVERRLGLTVTPLDVLQADTSFAPPPDLQDATFRPPVVRSRVEVASSRRPRGETGPLRPTDDVESSGRRRRTVPLALAAAVGGGLLAIIVALTAVLVTRGG
ncbi:hypothetical protein GCM10010401_05000 [Rarobacter faecitabidus]|uniref:non-specific serine/threonine protein kinase n=1 Tax=Rarobacter faecitabidus TaxID=13243 RepID=A0A542ZTV2_RARFA|nr:serine/threonine-protein kinase [Rarobacter faecitabidus]TQL63747.1 serine/threonine protein kinase [Rarobacter faecitabidus]